MAATKRKRKSKARRAAGARPGPARRMAGHLAPWARDAVGIGLVVLALLATLALWFDAAGVAGRAITYAIRGSVGVAAMTFPILALYWGVLLLRGTAEEDRVRMFIGFAIAVAGALGLFSLAAPSRCGAGVKATYTHWGAHRVRIRFVNETSHAQTFHFFIGTFRRDHHGKKTVRRHSSGHWSGRFGGHMQCSSVSWNHVLVEDAGFC